MWRTKDEKEKRWVEMTTHEYVQVPNGGEWVLQHRHEMVPPDDPRLTNSAAKPIQPDEPFPTAAYFAEQQRALAQAKEAAAREAAKATKVDEPRTEDSVPANPGVKTADDLDRAEAPTIASAFPKKELSMEENMIEPEEEYEDEYEEEDDEEEDDPPFEVTSKTLDEIDEMSPSQLEALIDNIAAHERWERLRERARERTEQWLNAIKKADEAPRCRYIKTDGRQCGSPAMKDQNFCYFHGEARIKREREETNTLQDVPILEDRLSLQLAITRLCAQLTSRAIDEKTSRLLIAALRLAHKNLQGSVTLY